jgi:hypothetical protein
MDRLALRSVLIVALLFRAGACAAAEPKDILGNWIEKFANGRGMVVQFTAKNSTFFPVDEHGQRSGAPSSQDVTYENGDMDTVRGNSPGMDGIRLFVQDRDRLVMDYSGMVMKTAEMGQSLREAIMSAHEDMKKQNIFEEDVSNIVLNFVAPGISLEKARISLSDAGLAPLSKIDCSRFPEICSKMQYVSETTIMKGFSARTTLTISVSVDVSSGYEAVKTLRAQLKEHFL